MRQRRFGPLLLLSLLLATPARADAPGVYAITGGTVHPVSGAAIPNGIVIIRDGLIEAVGANVPIPPDAAVIDVKGAHVYPGLIDAQTSLGFPAAAPRRGGGGGAGSAARPELPDTSPSFIAAREVRLSDDDLDAKRKTGVTTVVTAPTFGIFNGQSVVLNLGGGTPESRVIRNPAAQQISFNPRPTWTFPDSIMGVVAHIRQTMFDAQQHSAARAVYERNPAGNRRPDNNEALEAFGGAIRRDIPVVFIADSDMAMRRAQAIAKEFNVRFILSGARQGYKMIDHLRAWGAPLLVSVKWADAPTDRDDREEQPLRLIRERQLAPTTPAALAKAGVPFALVSGPGKSGDLLPGIRKAIDNGLSADDALRAVTITPARIFGVERQLGSLERGKIANVIVSDKPIFAKDAKVTRVFVDGRELRLPAEEKKEAGETGASPIDGGWDLTVRTPEGEVAIRATFRVEDGKLTGSYSSSRGSGEIRNGTIDGSAVSFTLAITGQQASESFDWVFNGTLADSTLSGTVQTNLGTFQFTGSKAR